MLSYTNDTLLDQYDPNVCFCSRCFILDFDTLLDQYEPNVC